MIFVSDSEWHWSDSVHTGLTFVDTKKYSDWRPLRHSGLEHAIESREGVSIARVQGYLAHKKVPPPQDHRRALGIVLLYRPEWGVGSMNAVPL